MATSNLTLKQRNQVGNLLDGKGIAIDCELDAHTCTVKHRPTGSWFRFQYDFNGYETVWQVTDGPELEWPGPSGQTWEAVLAELDRWSKEVVYVVGTPDFWQELDSSRAAIAAVGEAEPDNTPFTSAEQRQIAATFELAKLLVRERYSLPEKQLASMDRKIDKLVEASRTMGRKDWINTVGNIGFTLIVSALIPPEVVQHVLGEAVRAIAHMFGVGLPPLP